jgi:hypothetical protein
MSSASSVTQRRLGCCPAGAPEPATPTLVSRPTRFDLPAEWNTLEQALAGLGRSSALDGVLCLAKDHKPTSALLEEDYVDADYRNEYYSFYASTFRNLSERCRRLHFFRKIGNGPQERYLGFCVLRPIRSRPVGRTFIVPPRELRPYVSCLTSTVARPYGEKLRVSGFPFMEQDAQLGVCAHTSVWMAALYHHLSNHTPRRFISDVAAAANSRLEYWRPTPSDGLSDEQVGAALQEIKLPAISYAVAKPPLNEGVSDVVCRYLNSRLPVLLTTKEHVTVLIGYGRDKKGKLFFIRSDEGQAPYVPVYAGTDPLGEWDLLFVPMPGRIYLPAESAEHAARTIFTSLLRKPEHRGLRRELPTLLRLRTHVRQMGEYKARLSRRNVPPEAVDRHRYTPTSNWAWVVELQDPRISDDTRECVVGEVVIDATSDRLDPNPLFGNLAGYAYAWGDADELIKQSISYTGPYTTDCALHDAPRAPLQPQPALRQRMRARSRQLQRRVGASLR